MIKGIQFMLVHYQIHYIQLIEITTENTQKEEKTVTIEVGVKAIGTLIIEATTEEVVEAWIKRDKLCTSNRSRKRS